MVSDEELLRLMRDIESFRVERTVSKDKMDKFCEAVCAFCNDMPQSGQPGYLLVGVGDKGEPVGIEITDDLMKYLAGIKLNGNIQPLPSMTVEKRTVEGSEIAVVEVWPSDTPPVRYKGLTWIRVGSSRSVATEQDERILTERRLSKARSFDARVCCEAKLNDLALDLFPAYRQYAIDRTVLEENHRELVVQLASLRFYDLGNNCPTNAGIILFGTNPLYFLPGAYIQMVRYGGLSESDDIEDERVFSGDLHSALRQLDEFVKLHATGRPEYQSSLSERTVYDYPPRALRELLMNAVLHRNYETNTPVQVMWFSDRVEIQSPGGLYGEATRENFPRQTSYRNPVIAEAMKVLGYVNRFGRGVDVAQAALRDNGSPEATFQFEPNFFHVTIRRRP